MLFIAEPLDDFIADLPSDAIDGPTLDWQNEVYEADPTGGQPSGY
jgi:hypothetical protein